MKKYIYNCQIVMSNVFYQCKKCTYGALFAFLRPSKKCWGEEACVCGQRGSRVWSASIKERLVSEWSVVVSIEWSVSV